MASTLGNGLCRSAKVIPSPANVQERRADAPKVWQMNPEQISTKLRIYGLRRSMAYAAKEMYRRLWMQRVRGSYSQHGEDLGIDRLLNFPTHGFYVDVGANDPDRFSNTRRFYDRGWCGINIEPDPVLYQRLVSRRPRDTNLNIGVSRSVSTLDFYHLFPNTLSTFSKPFAEEYQRLGYKLEYVSQVQTKPLSQVFWEHSVSMIDFISIDTEGFDLQVLQSNDWDRYRPRALIVEKKTVGGTNNDGVEDFCRSTGYYLSYSNHLNAIYINNR